MVAGLFPADEEQWMSVHFALDQSKKYQRVLLGNDRITMSWLGLEEVVEPAVILNFLFLFAIPTEKLDMIDFIW